MNDITFTISAAAALLAAFTIIGGLGGLLVENVGPVELALAFFLVVSAIYVAALGGIAVFLLTYKLLHR